MRRQGDLDAIKVTRIAKNDGSGVFSDPADDWMDGPIRCVKDEYMTCAAANNIELTNFDDSGGLDLIIRSKIMAADRILTNSGYESFTEISSSVAFTKHPHPDTGLVRVVDLDSDGDNDFIVIASTKVEVYITTMCPTGGKGPNGACYACPDFAVRSTHADRCVECPAHHMAMDGAARCSPCPAGSARNVGADACTPCPAGMASTGGGHSCELCDIGRYGDSESSKDRKCSGACDEGHFCAEGSTTPKPAACTVGYFLEVTLDNNGASSFACVPCDDSVMDCSVPGVTLANMPIKAGGWRYASSTATIVHCFNPDACAGHLGIAAPLSNASGSVIGSLRRRQLSISGNSTDVQETFGDSLCAPGHRGFLCGECEEDWYGYKDNAVCTECTGSLFSAFLPLIGLVVVVVLASLIKWRAGSVSLNIETALEGGLQEAVNEKIEEKKEEAIEKIEGRFVEAIEANEAKSKPNIALRLMARAQKFAVKFKILVGPLWPSPLVSPSDPPHSSLVRAL